MKCLAIGSAILFAVFALFTMACCVLPLTEWRHPSKEYVLKQPCDFNMRYNEARCLLDGVDPFDVWHNGVIKRPYCPMGAEIRDGFNAPVNGYTPWEYIMVMPISLLPPRVAWSAYVILMFLSLGILAWGGYNIGVRITKDRWTAVVFATLPLLIVAHPIWSNFCIGNYSIPILASVFLMCWCLDRGYDVWAGVFWSIAMIKPQNALLLAVPLLMRKKVRTCITAAIICFGLSIVSAQICHKSVFALIMQIPSVGSDAFFGCGTLPSYFRDLMDVTPALAVAAVIGLIVCIVLTIRVKNARSWLMFVLPAVMCSISWTYTTSYSYAFAWVLCVGILSSCVSGMGWRRLTLLVIAAVLLLPRFYTCWHGAAVAFGFCNVSSSVNSAVETSVSLAILILTIWFCLFTTRKDEKQ